MAETFASSVLPSFDHGLLVFALLYFFFLEQKLRMANLPEENGDTVDIGGFAFVSGSSLQEVEDVSTRPEARPPVMTGQIDHSRKRGRPRKHPVDLAALPSVQV